MFSFFGMATTYDQRKVARDVFDWGFVSTARVTDGNQPYETAVKHASYESSQPLIIVEAYTTEDEARAGHAKWVSTMTGQLPDTLTDCCNSWMTESLRSMGAPVTATLRRA